MIEMTITNTFQPLPIPSMLHDSNFYIDLISKNYDYEDNDEIKGSGYQENNYSRRRKNVVIN